MNTTECIHSRRSIRHFADKPVPHEVLEEVIADAAYAPSWKNTQSLMVFQSSTSFCVPKS